MHLQSTGEKEVTGVISYTVENAMNSNNNSGTIIFDSGTNTETTYYTGKKLPIYSAGETKWYVDSEGNISLEVAGKMYGNGEGPNIWNGSWNGDTSKASESIAVDEANGLYLYKISDTVFTKEDLIGKTAYLITTEGVTQEMVLTSDNVISTGPTGTEAIAVEGFEDFIMFVIDNVNLGNGIILTPGVWAAGDSNLLIAEGISELGIRGLSGTVGSGSSGPTMQYGKLVIDDKEYSIDNSEVKRVYQELIGRTTGIYKITSDTYSSDEMLNKYLKVYPNNELSNAYLMNSSFIDETSESFMLFDETSFTALLFIKEGCTYSDSSLFGNTVLSEGIYLADLWGVLDEPQSEMRVINYFISTEDTSPILIETASVLKTVDTDLSESGVKSYNNFTETYFEMDEILNTAIIVKNGDEFECSEYITQEDITQIAEGVYKVDAYYDCIFAKEDTYIDTDNDGINDFFYPKGISVGYQVFAYLKIVK